MLRRLRTSHGVLARVAAVVNASRVLLVHRRCSHHPADGLPPPDQAQQLSVVRLPKFLSAADVQLILQEAEQIQQAGAGLKQINASSTGGAGGGLSASERRRQVSR